MSHYSLHKHPTLGQIAVKDAFSWAAFFFGWIWALTKKLWSHAALIGVVLALFIGAEIWQRTNLTSRGFTKKGTVKARTADQAFAFAEKLSEKSLTSTQKEERSSNILPPVAGLFAFATLISLLAESPGEEIDSPTILPVTKSQPAETFDPDENRLRLIEEFKQFTTKLIPYQLGCLKHVDTSILQASKSVDCKIYFTDAKRLDVYSKALHEDPRLKELAGQDKTLQSNITVIGATATSITEKSRQ